jgi:endothelin-converting enzyme/putative endopeptidase
LRWSLLNRASSQLSTDIENANFDFYGKNINRRTIKQRQDERALQVINGRIGALGKLYVEKIPS